jgi:hypothetical protein
LCGEIEIMERENSRREGGEIFIRVSKSKFNGYRSSILLTYRNILGEIRLNICLKIM